MTDKPDLKVVELKTDWAGRVAPKDVIEGALKDENIEDVLILSYTKDGALQAHSSIPELSENLLIAERFRFALISGQFEPL